jgi:flavin-dependent dehydrogenase
MESLTSNSDILDLAIIGGGPAGTAAALEGSRLGLQAAIWERDRFPRDKVCGEFISSEALPLLQSEIPGTVARGAEIRCAEFVSDNGLSRTFRLPCPALGLSRRVLDEALWKACEAAGIEVHEGESVRSVRKPGSGDRQSPTWEIETAAGNIRKAKALIVACGRWWTVEGLSSPARLPKSQTQGEWVGVKAHFAGIPARGNVEMYFFRGGYCGLAPVEDGACNVCCLVHRERVRECRAMGMDDFAAWLVQVSHLAALEKRLRGARQVSPVVTTAPVHLSRRQAAQSGALMVGDAAGFLDPFTGEGISMGLHSGRLAARAVAMALSEGFGNDRAAEIYCRSLKEAVRRSYTIAGMARGLIEGPVWLRGLVIAPLLWFGEHLFRGTRWRGGPEVEPG